MPKPDDKQASPTASPRPVHREPSASAATQRRAERRRDGHEQRADRASRAHRCRQSGGTAGAPAGSRSEPRRARRGPAAEQALAQGGEHVEGRVVRRRAARRSASRCGHSARSGCRPTARTRRRPAPWRRDRPAIAVAVMNQPDRPSRAMPASTVASDSAMPPSSMRRLLVAEQLQHMAQVLIARLMPRPPGSLARSGSRRGPCARPAPDRGSRRSGSCPAPARAARR